MSTVQGLPPSVTTKLKQVCVSCEIPSSFSYVSQVGDSASSGKSALAQSANNSDTIETTNITTVNLTSQNITTDSINSGIASLYTLNVVEIRGFRLTGNTDMNGATMVNVNIASGTIDNTIIGSVTPVEGHFTNLTATGDVTFYRNGSPCFQFDSSNGNLSICGNLTVGGTSTILESDTLYVQDVAIRLSNFAVTQSDARDRGVDFYWNNGVTTFLGFFGYDASVNGFSFIPDTTLVDGDYHGTLGNLYGSEVHCNSMYLGTSGNILTGSTSGLVTTSTTSIQSSAPSVTLTGTTSLNFVSTTVSVSGSSVVNVVSPAIAVTGTSTLKLVAPVVSVTGTTSVNLLAPSVAITGLTTIGIEAPAVAVTGLTTLALAAPSVAITGYTNLNLESPLVGITGTTTMNLVSPIVNISGSLELNMNSAAIAVTSQTIAITGTSIIGLTSPTVTVTGTSNIGVIAPAIAITGLSNISSIAPDVSITGTTNLNLVSPVVAITGLTKMDLVGPTVSVTGSQVVYLYGGVSGVNIQGKWSVPLSTYQAWLPFATSVISRNTGNAGIVSSALTNHDSCWQFSTGTTGSFTILVYIDSYTGLNNKNSLGGQHITSVLPSYMISGTPITGMTANLYSTTISRLTGARVVSLIGTWSLDASTGSKYPSLDLSTPYSFATDTFLSLELGVTMSASGSTLKYYGSAVESTMNTL